MPPYEKCGWNPDNTCAVQSITDKGSSHRPLFCKRVYHHIRTYQMFPGGVCWRVGGEGTSPNPAGPDSSKAAFKVGVARECGRPVWEYICCALDEHTSCIGGVEEDDDDDPACHRPPPVAIEWSG